MGLTRRTRFVPRPPRVCAPGPPQRHLGNRALGSRTAGDLALFAYRVRTERERQGEEQRDFVEGSGISQQALSEWERGVRVHITTEMLYLAARLTGLHIRELMARSTSAHTAERRVFSTAAPCGQRTARAVRAPLFAASSTAIVNIRYAGELCVIPIRTCLVVGRFSEQNRHSVRFMYA